MYGKTKTPLKFEVKITNKSKENLYGKAIFHEKSYKLVIKSTNSNVGIKIPFKVLGIMHEEHLVRLSGISKILKLIRLQFWKM